MSNAWLPRLFTIAPDMNFLDLLAARILAGGFPVAGSPPPALEALSKWRIYVPTRRAAGMLKEAFLRQSGQNALLLPRITPLGDPEEDELVLAGGAAADSDPADPRHGRGHSPGQSGAWT
jgi:ATP-dependent helicase/nuclease subunit B